MQTQNQPQTRHVHLSAWDVLLLGLEFGFIIGVPLVLFARWGHQLDVRLNHAHCYDITGVILALLFSGAVIGRQMWQMQKGLGFSMKMTK